MTRLSLLLILIALGVAACGGSGNNNSAPAAPSDDAAAREAGAAKTQEPLPEEPSVEAAPPPPRQRADTPSGKEIIISPDFADELRLGTGGWATDFTRHTVPPGEFLSGGPGKDGIPAIDDPTFVTVDEASEYLEPREPVVEIVIDDIARAYPIRVLMWHEIVNDVIGDVPVSVTFCPLCNSAIAFDRRLGEELFDFGTTGNLRNSDLVMYDRQTETWWQQFGGEGIVGELAGELLTQVPASIVSWEDFAARHPEAEVLSRDTGFDRPYGQNPYVGYDDIDQSPFFPVENFDDSRLPPKERVVLLDRRDETVVIPFADLEAAGMIEVVVNGETLVAEWVPGVRSALDSRSIGDGAERGSARVTDATGELVPYDTPFWFAVAAFRPDVRIVE